MSAEIETMTAETKANPEITRAAERYLEQYGDPLVMNTYLKVTILVLAAVCFALAALTFKSQTALAVFGAHGVREGVHQSGGPLRTEAGTMDSQRHLRLPREREEQ